MAEHGPLLTRLGDALAALDDDALAALANKGLLRRARKDLEQTPAELVVGQAFQPDGAIGQAFQPDIEAIQVRVAGETVVVPANPVQAHCSCPAGGVCRHILAALVFLRETVAAQPEPGDVSPTALLANELFASLDDEALRRWAGKALVRRATKALAEGLKVELDEGTGFIVRFPTRNIVCRLIPGAGLAGLICSCQTADVCEHRVAAVLAWQVAQGTRSIAPEDVMLAAADEAPRTREEVLASAQAVLNEMFSVGLARLSHATSQRLQTLAVSCHGVELPRLERWLTVLADETSRSLRRDAQSSTTALLEWSARVAALTAALARPQPRLVGRHRTTYEQVGNLSLTGVGAERWSSKAGYVGLTVYFWDESLANWCTWTDTRPTGTWGFDPVRRYQEYGPWDGCSSPKVASHSRLQLTSAWRNYAGRLSGRSRTRATVLGESNPQQLPAISDWSQISNRARKLFGGGLGERSEQDELVFFRPSLWLPGHYDEVRQELVRFVLDEKQRLLPLTLAFAAETASAINILEHYDATTPTAVFGRLRLRAGRLSVEPISLLTPTAIVNLTLDDSGAARHATISPAETHPAEAADVGEDEISIDEPPIADALLTGTSTPLGVFLSSIEAELERIAESGTSVRRDLAPVEQAAARSEALGLEAVSSAMKKLVEKLRVAPQANGIVERTSAAAALLSAAYIVRLAIVEESLALATAGLA